MKSKNDKKNNSKSKTLLNKKTKRTNKESILEKEGEETLVPKTITKDSLINMKSVNKKYQLVKCLINGLDYVPFEFFQSINNIFYIIYIKKDREYNSLNKCKEKNIISFYDIIKEQIIFQIKNPHSDSIKDIKYIFDKKNKRDLIVSISLSTIKIWNFKNMQVLYEINKEYKDDGYYNIVNIINNALYIHIIEAYSFLNIIAYNIGGKKINIIKNDKKIFGIESFMDYKVKKSYIIANYDDCLVSYDHDKNKKYMNYCHNTYNERFKIIIKQEEENTKIIGLGLDYPFIIIWDFHSGNKLLDVYLKQKIKNPLNLGISNSFLWDNNHLCLAFTLSHKFNLLVCNLKLFDLKKYKISEEIMDIDKRNIWKIKRFQHPLYGDCLITQNSGVNIEIWKLKNGN